MLVPSVSSGSVSGGQERCIWPEHLCTWCWCTWYTSVPGVHLYMYTSIQGVLFLLCTLICTNYTYSVHHCNLLKSFVEKCTGSKAKPVSGFLEWNCKNTKMVRREDDFDQHNMIFSRMHLLKYQIYSTVQNAKCTIPKTLPQIPSKYCPIYQIHPTKYKKKMVHLSTDIKDKRELKMMLMWNQQCWRYFDIFQPFSNWFGSFMTFAQILMRFAVFFAA